MCLLPDQVCLEGHLHTQYLGPDEDQERSELLSRTLQQLQHVGEDDHTEGQGHGPVTKFKESRGNCYTTPKISGCVGT